MNSAVKLLSNARFVIFLRTVNFVSVERRLLQRLQRLAATEANQCPCEFAVTFERRRPTRRKQSDATFMELDWLGWLSIRCGR